MIDDKITPTEQQSSEVDQLADITVVTVNYNTAHLIPEFLGALEAARGELKLQIIVVENGSTDGSAEILRLHSPAIELIENERNVGFGRANNQTLDRINGRYVLLLNTDAFVEPDTLAKTLQFMDSHDEVGVLGVKLIGRSGELQPSCRYFPTPWNTFVARYGLTRLFPSTRLVDDLSWDHASIRDCDWVPGCYYLVRRKVIDHVGLFDSRYFIYFEEVDHCRSLRAAGWRVVFYPFTSVVHIGGESAKSAGQSLNRGRQIPALQVESELLYFRKHYGLLGLLAALSLKILGDALSLAKWIAKGRGDGSPSPVTGVMFKVLVRTRLASRPSR